MTDQADRISIPCPKPDQAVIVICDEDGAFAWIKGSRSALCDAVLLAEAEPLLMDAQRRLREQHPKPVPALATA